MGKRLTNWLDHDAIVGAMVAIATVTRASFWCVFIPFLTISTSLSGSPTPATFTCPVVYSALKEKGGRGVTMYDKCVCINDTNFNYEEGTI
jgi:hypothetical protein